jgi:dethiobiotin synthase
MDGVFITGTDTNVGKTSLSAGLLRMLYGSKPVVYWKPVQTGTMLGDDTKEVLSLSKIEDPAVVIEPTYRFTDPVSPHFAAKKWGKRIEVSEIVAQFEREKKQGKFLLVEGAGGLLVPFNERELQLDLILRLKLPLIIATVDRVGAINQTLLTLNACRKANIDVLGVVVTRSRGNLGNSEAIAEFGKVEILAEFPPIDDLTSMTALVAANPRLRELFQLQPLP